jgi:hypothetical protein
LSMTTRRQMRSSNEVLVVVGLVLIAAYLVFFFFLMDRASWDAWGAMLIGPVLFVVTLPALARQARREGDRRVFWFLTAALAVKFAFSLFRYYSAFVIVGKADAVAYDRAGTEIALRFLGGDFTSGLSSLTDTNFIRFFTGVIYTVIRPSAVSGFLIYAWLAFWGTYFFYRAFVVALPDGNRRSYARWLFLMPSILFWPSSIGKESWLIFGLGIAAFGTAKMLSERVIPGLLVSVVGLSLVGLVRAPSAVALGAGLVLGGLLRRTNRNLRQLAPIAKLGAIAVFAGLAVVLAVTLQDYLIRDAPGRSGTTDLGTVVTESRRVTSTGGSEFTPARLISPAGIVIVPVTVLFRPFINEANNYEAVAASIEASLLLLVSIIRWRAIWKAIRSLRRTPYIAVAMVYVAASIVALSPVANFGIIVRQRTLIYPMYLVLLCVHARRRAAKPHPVASPIDVRTRTFVGSRP